jgi:hypothetical protein
LEIDRIIAECVRRPRRSLQPTDQSRSLALEFRPPHPLHPSILGLLSCGPSRTAWRSQWRLSGPRSTRMTSSSRMTRSGRAAAVPVSFDELLEASDYLVIRALGLFGRRELRRMKPDGAPHKYCSRSDCRRPGGLYDALIEGSPVPDWMISRKSRPSGGTGNRTTRCSSWTTS